MISRLFLLSIFLGLFISENAAVYVCPGVKRVSDSDVRARADAIYALGESLDSQRAGQREYGGIKFIGRKGSGYFAYEGVLDPHERSDKVYKVQVEHPSQEAFLLEITQGSGSSTGVNCGHYPGA
ncbi:BgTH12-06227 [Blumeria graminis f. sp. triticale]|uniref:BgTH12-06225 n=1 Tax=Blumeria graminis f. sp. triticale TaxID=1689686 RepID=A0A9W4CY58_BLUGR|nr:BgTH12-06225 [Blumeria graminis f. sp. triticale]CAD6500517.1 BgTH12-06227 [Blumeria graminis f. sp. triticale]